MTKKIIIIDDEPLARINLRKLIEQYTDWKIILELESGQNIEEYITQLNPDAVFLDIEMPNRNGISTAEGLANLNNPPFIVFVSAYNEFALQAFELSAVDYLLKPLSDDRFIRTVERLNSFSRKTLPSNNEIHTGNEKKYIKVLVIRSIGTIQIVDLNDVIWFQACGNYVEVMLAQEKYLHRASINFLESNLDPQKYARCHRSAIVRLSSIKEINTLDDGQFLLVLENGDATKLSHTYKEKIIHLLEN